MFFLKKILILKGETEFFIGNIYFCFFLSLLHLEKTKKTLLVVNMTTSGTIALYVATRDTFFHSKACVNCSVERYCAFEGADVLQGIDDIMRTKLVRIMPNVLISTPYIIDRPLRRGDYIMATVSHKGVLAIFSEMDGYGVEFYDFTNDHVSDIKVETYTKVGFYDDKLIMITSWHPLRECEVETVFSNDDKTINYTKLGDIDTVYCEADVTTLNSTRVLCYLSTENISYEYNVDTGTNKEIEIEEGVGSFLSFTGIDIGVKAIFKEWEGNWGLFYLDKNDVTHPITLKEKINTRFLTDLIPSESSPLDLDKALKVDDCFEFSTTRLHSDEGKTKKNVEFQGHNAIVRIFKDIFLLYDISLFKWVLVRIIVY